MRTAHFGWILVLVLLFSAMPAFGEDPPTQGDTLPGGKPWTLRDRYTFSVPPFFFDYDEKHAGWRVRKDETHLAESAGFEVLLGDDTQITPYEMEDGVTERQPAKETPYGKTTAYVQTFPPKDGLEITHEVTAFVSRSFLLMRLGIRNMREKAVVVRELRPVVVAAGGFSGFGVQAELRGRPFVSRDRRAVVDTNSPVLMALFQDPDQNTALALGVLPDGNAASGADFQPSGGSWQGSVRCDYAPGHTLDPGEMLWSDRVWISYGIQDAEMVDTLFAWYFGEGPKTEGAENVPLNDIRGWVSAEEGESLNSIERAAAVAKKIGLSHVLIPNGWEGRPGSMRGAASRYPANMAQAADTLRGLGVTPGITLDPLAVQGGKEAWTAQSADGQAWVNPAKEEARAFARERMAKAAKWDFGFLCVAPSAIPDEVLRRFGISRAAADHHAMAIVAKAAGSTPVYPASVSSLHAAAEAWREAAGAAAQLMKYGSVLGPVRLEAGSAEMLGEAAVSAMRAWPGPIEVLGVPSPKLRKELAGVFAGE